jgi:hypothetical protein
MNNTTKITLNLRQRKACIPCTQAKRRCDKNVPSCRRCVEKEIECQYPTTKRYARVNPAKRAAAPLQLPLSGLLQLSLASRAAPSVQVTEGGGHEQNSAGGKQNPLANIDGPQDLWDEQTAVPPDSSAPDAFDAENREPIDGSWFMDSDSWMIEHSDGTNNRSPPVHITVFRDFITGIQTWLQQWVKEGRNPFIHKHLYFETGLPMCLQDAWTTLTAYLSKSRDNEDIIMQIVESRANGLLLQQPISDGSFMSVPGLDTAGHLARVQALFIYQFIRLFDGCIRQRALAENVIPTLTSWCHQLWESADLDASTGTGTLPGSTFGEPSVAVTRDSTPQLWRAWVLAESVRRTWMITHYTQCVYLTLRDGWAECMGGIMFTARQGLWDAASSIQWAEVARHKDPLFIPTLHMDRLLAGTQASEVDEFSSHVMSVIWGSERIEAWRSQTAPPPSQLDPICA